MLPVSLSNMLSLSRRLLYNPKKMYFKKSYHPNINWINEPPDICDAIVEMDPWGLKQNVSLCSTLGIFPSVVFRKCSFEQAINESSVTFIVPKSPDNPVVSWCKNTNEPISAIMVQRIRLKFNTLLVQLQLQPALEIFFV